MQGIDSCVVFAKQLPPAVNIILLINFQKVTAYIIPYIKKFAEDKSWRIRYLVADRIIELSNGLGLESSKENLLPYYV